MDKKYENSKRFDDFLKEQQKLQKRFKRALLFLGLFLTGGFCTIDYFAVHSTLMEGNMGGIQAMGLAIIFALLLDSLPYALGVVNSRKNNILNYDENNILRLNINSILLKLGMTVVFGVYVTSNLIVFLGGGHLDVGLAWINLAFRGLLQGRTLYDIAVELGYREGANLSIPLLIPIIVPVATSILSYVAGSLLTLNDKEMVETIKRKLEATKTDLEAEKEKIRSKKILIAGQAKKLYDMTEDYTKDKDAFMTELGSKIHEKHEPIYKRVFSTIVKEYKGKINTGIGEYMSKIELPISDTESSTITDLKKRIIEFSTNIDAEPTE